MTKDNHQTKKGDFNEWRDQFVSIDLFLDLAIAIGTFLDQYHQIP